MGDNTLKREGGDAQYEVKSNTLSSTITRWVLSASQLKSWAVELGVAGLADPPPTVAVKPLDNVEFRV
jgi:hypothetical protein